MHAMAMGTARWLCLALGATLVSCEREPSKGPNVTVLTLPVGQLETNCFIVSDGATPDALVVDPGGDVETITAAIEDNGLAPRIIFATHGHVDHVGALDDLAALYPEAVTSCLDIELETLTRPTLNLSFFLGGAVEPAEPTKLVTDGDELVVGSMTFRVIHVPGHTPGGAALYADVGGEHVLFAGDALFAGSIGRTDFPGGSARELIEGIRLRLFVLPDDTTVYAGHGPRTTIGQEKRNNPFAALGR